MTAPKAAVAGREIRSCYKCGSTLRFRTIVAALSQALFGKVIPLPDFPFSPHLHGLGTSDADIYAIPLAQRTAFRNTFYHQEPRLDVTDTSGWPKGAADFIICSDVFEHILAPVERGFEGLCRLVKPGGVCIFSAPYSFESETREHFPNLFDWKIERDAGGNAVLHNTTRNGERETFTDLCFHGGDGSVLEMRLYAFDDIKRKLRNAGFSEVHVDEADIPEFGILRGNRDAYVFVARK